MIDEYFQKNAPKLRSRASANVAKVSQAVSVASKKAVTGTGNAFYNGVSSFSTWFDNFRWIEFCTVVTAAMFAGMTMATNLNLSESIGQKMGAFGAVVTAISFIRSPKTKWETSDAKTDDEE